MKLTRLRVEQFRQFRSALEIRDFAPGLNLFTGPNEVGKSTVVAAIRAAFFERHRSGAVDDLRPWGDSAAAPGVELDFELDGQPCRLVKTFLARKRCELVIGREALDGEEAETRLAELLGYQHAGRGASKAEHWGIPGLLWIQQGAAHELRDAVGHATDHLRSALEASLGEVAASGGDELLAAVEAQRNELLTEAGGRPRGAYKDALEREAALADALRALDASIAHYRQRVDALATLRREHAADEAEQPWQDFRARQQAAEAQLAAIREVEATLTAARERAAQADVRVALLRRQLEAFAREEKAADERAAALAAARAQLAAASAPVEQWSARRADAAAALERARATLRAIRAHEARSSLAREARDSRARLDAASAQLAKAEAAQGRVLALQRAVAATEIRSADLEALRTQERELADLRLQQAAAATRVAYVLDPGRSIVLDGETLSGSGEQRLLAAATLVLPGLGRIAIAPGGTDLAELAARADDLDTRQRALLARLGLASLAAAEERQRAHSRAQGELATAVATLHALAPQGIDALRAELARLQARTDEAAHALAQLPPIAADGAGPERVAGDASPAGDERARDRHASGATAGDATAGDATAGDAIGGDATAVDENADDTMAVAERCVPRLSVAQAEAAEQAAAQSLAQVNERLHAAQLAVANAQAAAAAAERELAAARTVLDAPDRAGRLAEANTEHTDARAEAATLAARIDALSQQIAAARPDILAQDVARYRASADELEKRHAERRDQLVRLEVELQTEGAQGLEERRAELARDHAHASRRATELRRRAAALDFLLRLLRDKRRALTRRLQAPLQKHLNRYLQLLFPNASLEIDEDLAPGPLTRPAANGSETGEFEALSFGAREQMGVISRLAYADLLAEAGRPTLVILDDALVHSDPERLAQMKRVLFDAATRHQILLFTCHPANWRDLGVAARSLEGLRVG
ncbi:MAG TPA: AAA family ATPase [Rhodocyclaceae bacterium]|nr:AAA family ATPase [Rhodocyclaceae bacterium]